MDDQLKSEYLISYAIIIIFILAGFPIAMESLGISFVTTLPAPMTALSPIVTPGKIVQFPPIQTFLPIVTGLPNSTSNNRSFESNEWQDVYICVFVYMTGGESHSVRYMRATTKPLVRATSSDKRASPYRLAS